MLGGSGGVGEGVRAHEGPGGGVGRLDVGLGDRSGGDGVGREGVGECGGVL